MATIVNLGPDLRYQSLGEGVSQGVTNFFEAKKKKKLEEKFKTTLDRINTAQNYEEAATAIGMADPEIASNPDVMRLYSEHLARKFPEQEALEVVDPNTRETRTITHTKGRPPSAEELAKQGLTRAADLGIGSFLTMDEGSGEVDFVTKVTAEEAQAKHPNRLVVPVADAGEAAALKNAYAAMLQAGASRTRAASESRTPEWEAVGRATAVRLGLDWEDPNQQAAAIRVVKDTPPTRTAFREFYTKSAGGEIFFTDDIARAHIAEAEQLIEPAFVLGQSPADTQRLMVISASYNIANDPAITIEEAKSRAAADFTRLTGIGPGERGLQEAYQKAQASLEPGQLKDIPLTNKQGKIQYYLRFVRIGNQVVPVARINP